MSELHVPAMSLVVLVGATGSGKSTFAARAFGPFETISSDYCRALVSNDANSQDATKDAFALLHHIVGVRLKNGLLTVVDATNVQPEARRQLVRVAKEHDVLPVAIVLNPPESVLLKRTAERRDRSFGDHVPRRQVRELKRGLRGLGREGFRIVHQLSSVEEIEAATIVRDPLYSDRRGLTGPFDVIGDVHGCRAELETLLTELGYELIRDEQGRPIDATPPAGRTAVFVGDLVDRGPDTPGVLRLVMGMHGAGHALVVTGNHEAKLVRALNGKNMNVSHGLAETLAQLERETPEFRTLVRDWCDSLIAHYVLDGGRLVVAHAGLKEAFHNRASGRVRSFALYGDTTGESDEYGLPVRLPWAKDYRGKAMVLYGHTPTTELTWINNTLCLDTGCVFGGALSALRYPEREVVQVPAEQVWSEPIRPLAADTDTRTDDDLRLSDLLEDGGVQTSLLGRVTIKPENAAGALETMSRHALAPEWLPYLPPTMAPADTSHSGGFLEHPLPAFGWFGNVGVPQVVCEEKHMGSRAVLWIRPDDGVIYTRTGRAFLAAAPMRDLVDRVRLACARAGVFDQLESDWVLLDAEILPWSFKAEQMLKEQFAVVSAAASAALPAVGDVLAKTLSRAKANPGLFTEPEVERLDQLAGDIAARASNAAAYAAAYRRYRWETNGLDGVQIAPFQVLAAAGQNLATRDHLWHLGIADALVAADPQLFRPTLRLVVDTKDEASCHAGVSWWLDLVENGDEGMVVKPLANQVRGPKGLVQPGLKVRGPEYLRIIYGPDYLEAETLTRLRSRNLGRKRSMALREYALGMESIDRLVAGEPLWRIHEPVFGVLALESEPVDPRL